MSLCSIVLIVVFVSLFASSCWSHSTSDEMDSSASVVGSIQKPNEYQVLDWLKSDPDFDRLTRDDEGASGEGVTMTDDDDRCIICMDSFGKREAWTLVCRHKFHKACLKRWARFQNNARCPLCKSDLVLESGLDIMKLSNSYPTDKAHLQRIYGAFGSSATWVHPPVRRKFKRASMM